ncbi:hypothetical protein BWI17_03850 [Betaproteobacteria bacterium GR16-43]|nr:hypothetical protein BWI17_03850 [Betaproteobacteria bacterium GR16-43]
MTLKRATISADPDRPDEVALLKSWLEQNAMRLTITYDESMSSIHMWDVEGPSEIIDTIPHALSTQSDWSASLDQS